MSGLQAMSSIPLVFLSRREMTAAALASSPHSWSKAWERCAQANSSRVPSLPSLAITEPHSCKEAAEGEFYCEFDGRGLEREKELSEWL